jgi:hypothetical protein
VRVIRFTALEGGFGVPTEKPLGDVRVHEDGTLDPDPTVEDIVGSWKAGVMRMRGVTDPYEVAEKFLARYRNWSNGYVISREQETLRLSARSMSPKSAVRHRTPEPAAAGKGLRNEYPSMRLSRPLTRRLRPHRIPTSQGPWSDPHKISTGDTAFPGARRHRC